MPPKYGTFKEYLKDRYEGPFCATDIIIRYNNGNKEGLVLIDRKYPPLGRSIPGGIAERMAFDRNAFKEAKEETGLDVILDDIEKPLCVLSEVDQDPRAFIASITYTGRGYGTLKPQQDEDAKTAEVYTYDEINDLLKDGAGWAFPKHHRRILQIFLEQEGYHAR